MLRTALPTREPHCQRELLRTTLPTHGVLRTMGSLRARAPTETVLFLAAITVVASLFAWAQRSTGAFAARIFP